MYPLWLDDGDVKYDNEDDYEIKKNSNKNVHKDIFIYFIYQKCDDDGGAKNLYEIKKEPK